MLNCVFYNQIMSVERCGVIIIIVFEYLSRLEFQLLGLSIQVTRASPGVATPLVVIMAKQH